MRFLPCVSSECLDWTQITGMRGKYATKKHPLTRVAISEGAFRVDKGSDQKTLPAENLTPGELNASTLLHLSV